MFNPFKRLKTFKPFGSLLYYLHDHWECWVYLGFHSLYKLLKARSNPMVGVNS